MKLIWLIGPHRRAQVLALALFLVGGATYADYATGRDLAVSVLYVLPVALAALVGLSEGAFLSVLAAGGWLLADALANTHYSHPLIPYADALVQLPLFLAIAYLVSAMQRARLMQQELMEFIIHDLKTPLTAIRAALQTARRNCDVTNPTLGTVLRAGMSSLDRMTTMITALLDVARADERTYQDPATLNRQASRARPLASAVTERRR